MTILQLSKYTRLGLELQFIEAQLRQMPIVCDRVQSSEKEYPYLSRKVTIKGIDTKRVMRLRWRRAYLKRKRTEIETFLCGLDDSYMQKVIWARYIDGDSWVEIADQMSVTFESIKKASNRYLKKVCGG